MVCDEASVGVEVPKATPPPEIRRRVWPQHVAALLATLLAMSGGIVMGWSTPAVPYLQEAVNDTKNGTIVPITDEEGSWLGSLSAIGALVGAAPAGFLSDLVGRKRMLLLFSLPLIASWIMIILVDRNIPLLYLARVLGGVTIGGGYAVLPVYCEEITEVRFRGFTGLFTEVMNCFGVLLSFVLGAYVPYTYFNVFNCVLPVIFLMTFVWMPESPMWLLMKGRDVRAEKSLRWLRGAATGPDVGISAELEAMRLFLKTEEELSSASREDSEVSDSGARFWEKPSTKATFIVFWLMIFQQMSGINAIMFNAVSVFQQASSSVDSNIASIITGFIQEVACTSTSVIVDRTGRRPLLIYSLSVGFVFLLVMVIYFQFLAHLSVGWLPVVAISTFIFNIEVGIGGLPWLIMAELSPAHAKKTIGAICCPLNWLIVFISTKTFSDMLDKFGFSITYGFYAIICGAGIVFIYLFVPETKHKTREQIQYELRFGRNAKMPDNS